MFRFFFLHKVNLEKPWEHFLFVKCFFFLLSNIRVDRLCLINLALSNHHDLTKIKSIDRPINSSSISQCWFKCLTYINVQYPTVCVESGS